MTSGDIGAVIAINVSGLGYLVPAISTITVLAAPAIPGTMLPASPEVAIPGTVTVTPDQTTVLYATAGNGLDFQSGGNWIVKARIVPPSGQIRTSPPGVFWVNPA